MKNVAVLHDALRGETFGFVVKSAGVLSFHGVDASSSQWASWVNQSSVKSVHAVDMPPGVIVGAFKQMSDEEFAKISSGDSDSVKVNVSSRTNKSYVTTVRQNSKSQAPCVFDTPIKHFNNSQFLNAINYKGLAFRADAKKSSLIHEAKVNRYSFDPETAKFNVRPSVEQKELIRERIESNTSASFERRLGIKSVKFSENDGGRSVVGHVASMETKSLGRTISGRAGGVARMARRAARFDPKAWDGDGDGLVQEGTPFQRPAIPGVNDRASRGNVDVAAVERAILSDRAKNPAAARAITPEKRTPTTTARARREMATMDAGMRSRTKKASRALPGVDKVAEIDGTAWESMTDEQKSIVKQNLGERLKALQASFKKNTDFWDAYLRNPKNRKRHPGIGEDSDFTADFMVALQADIQDAERDAIAEIPLSDEKRDEKLAKIDKKFQEYYRMFDDLRTIRAMQERDNYTSLEHLHPVSREAAIGKSRAKGTSYKPVDGDFPSLKRTNQSTFFGKSGREKRYRDDQTLETGEKAKIKKRTDSKIAGLSKRILDPNPKRVARKERRRARKAGTARAAVQAEAQKAGIKRRIRRARRAISGRLRGEETASQILKRANRNKVAHPLEIKDGDSPGKSTIKISDKWVSALAFVSREVDRKKRGEKGEDKRSDSVSDVALLHVWENMEHNVLPTQITEDQFDMLVDEGWRPVNRGVGNDTGFVDTYLEDEDRFIPAQGGRAYGVGEYWAPDGSSHQWGYGNANMIGFVSPDARTIEDRQLQNIVDEGKKIQEAIRKFDVGFPGDEASNMDPKEYVDSLMASLEEFIPKDSPLWKTELGQIYSQLLELYAKSGGDSEKKSEIWDAMQYLNKMFSHDFKYFAPVLGYDVIEVRGAVTLVHNRGAMILVNKPLSIQEGRQAFARAKGAA